MQGWGEVGCSKRGRTQLVTAECSPWEKDSLIDNMIERQMARAASSERNVAKRTSQQKPERKVFPLEGRGKIKIKNHPRESQWLIQHARGSRTRAVLGATDAATAASSRWRWRNSVLGKSCKWRSWQRGCLHHCVDECRVSASRTPATRTH